MALHDKLIEKAFKIITDKLLVFFADIDVIDSNMLFLQNLHKIMKYLKMLESRRQKSVHISNHIQTVLEFTRGRQ